MPLKASQGMKRTVEGSLGLLTQTQPVGPACSAHLPPPQQVRTYFGSLLLGLFQFVHFNLLGLGCGEKTQAVMSSVWSWEVSGLEGCMDSASCTWQDEVLGLVSTECGP